MKKYIAFLIGAGLVVGMTATTFAGFTVNRESKSHSLEAAVEADDSDSIEISKETGIITVSYYTGNEILQIEKGEDLRVQVPEDQEEASNESEGIAFPEAPEEFVKAKAFYGYYILMDTDVIFALNEDETRFAVSFNGIGGRPMYMEGNINPDGTAIPDNIYNGLFGEDVQTMYEDALEEEADWAPILR